MLKIVYGHLVRDFLSGRTCRYAGQAVVTENNLSARASTELIELERI